MRFFYILEFFELVFFQPVSQSTKRESAKLATLFFQGLYPSMAIWNLKVTTCLYLLDFSVTLTRLTSLRSPAFWVSYYNGMSLTIYPISSWIFQIHLTINHRLVSRIYNSVPIKIFPWAPDNRERYLWSCVVVYRLTNQLPLLYVLTTIALLKLGLVERLYRWSLVLFKVLLGTQWVSQFEMSM